MVGDEEGKSGSLTDAERAAVYTALDRGYFAVPRRATLTEVSEELETPDVEASERIRRGVATVLEMHRSEQSWE